MTPKKYKFTILVDESDNEVCYYLDGKLIDDVCGDIADKDRVLLEALAQHGIEVIHHKLGETFDTVADYEKTFTSTVKAKQDAIKLIQKIDAADAKTEVLRTELYDLTEGYNLCNDVTCVTCYGEFAL